MSSAHDEHTLALGHEPHRGDRRLHAERTAHSGSIVARLILKDLQLQRPMILGAFVIGAAALALMPFGELGLFVGWVLLFVVLIILGVFTAMVGVMQERKDRVHLFVLSLPVSPAQYTAAKVAANLTAFLVPWAILTAASFVVIAATSIPDGLLPSMAILMLYVVCYYSIFLSLGLVSDSAIWSTVVIVCGNLAPTFFIPALYGLPGVSVDAGLPALAWGPEVIALLAFEVGVSVLALGLGLVLRFRQRDLV